MFNMSSQLALHIDHNHQRHTHICQSLKSLGFELHKAPMFPVAKELAKKFRYRLFIIDFDTAGKQTYKFCSFIRTSTSNAIIIVLMSSPKISVEEHLFDCGVNDVIIGIQATARVLSKRIQVRIRNNKPLLLETNLSLCYSRATFLRSCSAQNMNRSHRFRYREGVSYGKSG